MNSPTLPTVKRLFAMSGNKCAFPRCPIPLVDKSSGKVTGKICHIKAQSPGGPRYDPTQSDEGRHAFENLLLLCPIHHDVIDSDLDSYTVDRLLKIKSEYEKSNQCEDDPSDEIANKLITNIFEGSLLLSQNQSGGQVAHQITNYLAQPDVSAALEREIQVRRDTHDLEVFERSDSILNEIALDEGVNLLTNDHSYHRSFNRSISEFTQFFEKAQNQYLNSNLETLSAQLSDSLRELSRFLVYNFFVYPKHRTFEDTRYCLYPDLNVDRAGTGLPEEMIRYDQFAEQLIKSVDKVSENFAKYRKAVKKTLCI